MQLRPIRRSIARSPDKPQHNCRKLPSFAKLLFSAGLNLGDSAVAAAMHEITGEYRPPWLRRSIVSDDRCQDVMKMSCC